MSKDKITVNMNIHDIPILVEELEKADKEISRLNNIIDELRKHFEMLKMNCDKRDREFFEDIILYIDKLNKLKGDNK